MDCQEAFQGSALPPGVTIKSAAVTVTDASGAALPVVTLTGIETPTPWSTLITVASGAGSVVSVFTDSTGATTTITQAYDTIAPQAALAPSGTTVTIVTP